MNIQHEDRNEKLPNKHRVKLKCVLGHYSAQNKCIFTNKYAVVRFKNCEVKCKRAGILVEFH